MILDERYEYDPKQDRLGRGGFGTVYQAYDQQEQCYVALKFVQKSKLPERYSLYQEILRIKGLQHPHLVEYYDAFKKPYENVAGEMDEMQVGVMEYINGGDLGAFMRTKAAQNEKRVRSILLGILKGLQFLHQNKIIHRDIKPQNILLKLEGNQIIPKIADFSISKQMGGEMTSVSATVGTYEYMSPEQLGKANAKIGPSSDIWSFGVLAYHLLVGKLPFGSRRTGDTDGQIIANIVNPNTHPDFQHLNPPYREIIQKCLCKNIEDRFQSVDEILLLLDQEEEQNTEVLPLNTSLQDIFKTQEPHPDQTIIPEKEEPAIYTQTSLPELTSDSVSADISSDEPIVEEEESAASPAEMAENQSISAPKTNSSKPPREDKSASRMALLIVLLLLALTVGYFVVKGFRDGKQAAQNSERTEATRDSLTQKEQVDTREESESTPRSSSQSYTASPRSEQEYPTPSIGLDGDTKVLEIPNEDGTTRIEIKEKSGIFTERKKEGNQSRPANNRSRTYTSNAPKYDYKESYPNGSIVYRDGQAGFIDQQGKIVIPIMYEDFSNFQEGLAAVKKGGKWGYINQRNQVVIPFRYDRPGVFRNGRANVTLKGQDFYIDKRGNRVD